MRLYVWVMFPKPGITPLPVVGKHALVSGVPAGQLVAVVPCSVNVTTPFNVSVSLARVAAGGANANAKPADASKASSQRLDGPGSRISNTPPNRERETHPREDGSLACRNLGGFSRAQAEMLLLRVAAVKSPRPVPGFQNKPLAVVPTYVVNAADWSLASE